MVPSSTVSSLSELLRRWQVCQLRLLQKPLQVPGQRAEARKQGNPVTPLLRQRYQAPNSTSGQPVQGNKGVLRTIGSKSTFAYFSLTRKVGRRRHNTRQYTVGQKRRKPIVSRKTSPAPAHEGTKKTRHGRNAMPGRKQDDVRSLSPEGRRSKITSWAPCPERGDPSRSGSSSGSRDPPRCSRRRSYRRSCQCRTAPWQWR